MKANASITCIPDLLGIGFKDHLSLTSLGYLLNAIFPLQLSTQSVEQLIRVCCVGTILTYHET